MALVPQNIPVVMKGIDTKTDSRHAVLGEMVGTENVRFDEWPRLRKRWGYKRLGSAPAGAQLAAFKGQLLLGTGTELYSYAASAGLVDQGPLESVALSVRPVVRNGYSQQTPDAAVHPLGISVYTYESIEAGATVSRYSVVDSATQQPLVVGRQIGTAAVKPKPLALGNYVVILYYETSNNHLRYIAIPAASPASVPSAVDVATDPSTSNVWDATVIGGQDGALFVTYLNSASSNKITLKALSPTLVLGAATVPTTTESYSGCVTIFTDSAGNVWVAYYTGSAVKAFRYDFYLSSQLLTFTTIDASPGTVRNITGVAWGTVGVYVLYETAGSATYNNMVKVAALDYFGNPALGAGASVRSVGLASKAFLVGSRLHYLAAYQSPLQSSYFMISFTGPSRATVVARLAPGVGGGLTTKSILPEVSAVSAGAYQTAYLQADQLTSSGGNVFTQKGVQAATFDFTQPQASQELSDNLHLTGGILSMWDGAQACEHGFHVYPEPITATASGSGTFAGSYLVCAVYEWMDNYGLIHQSAPSPAVTVVASNAAQFNLTAPTLRLTSKTTPIAVVFYRTISNQSGPFYRVNSITSPLLNSTTVDSVSCTDTTADATITGNAQLYSAPTNDAAEAPNLPAPAPAFVTKYRNRAIVIPAENPYQWVLSKEVVPGVPVEFNPEILYQSIEQEGGPLTCAIEMDEKLILFKRDRIYFIAGNGPAANGTGSDYGTPNHIPSDCGCVNPRSLALIPQGVLFQSAKGIQLLDRGLGVHYLGANAEEFNDAAVTAVRMDPNSRRVVFFLDSGIALVLDYTGLVVVDGPEAGAKWWSTWTNYNGADAAIFGGLLTFVQPNGLLMQETPGRYLDDGNPVLASFTTSVFSFAGLSGFQRVWRIMIRGDYRSPHGLSAGIAYDDGPPTQFESVDAGALLGGGAVGDTTIGGTDNPGGGPSPFYEWVIKPAQQKCTSIQLTIRETQTIAPYGEGLSLSGLSFQVGALKGQHRISPARTL